MSEEIYPSKEMKECIYEFYSLTYNSKFSLGKKRHLMTAALGYEKWGWRVVGKGQRLPSELELELARAGKELAEVKMERDVLKKFAPYFAKESR